MKMDKSSSHPGAGLAFAGPPDHAGKMQGRIWRPWRDAAISKLQHVYESDFHINGITRLEFITKYMQLLEQWAPHWLPEYEGMSRELDMRFDKLIFLNAARYISMPADKHADNCTSWVMMPDVTECGGVILHKNRDGGNQWQGWILKHVDGTLKWMGMADIFNAGTLIGVNESGVAAAMNNGENCHDACFCGLSTPDILRLILERSLNAKEAVELCREIILAGHYAHGVSGSIFIISDAHSAFIIENTARKAISREIRQGFEVRSNDWLLPGMRATALEPGMRRRISDISRRNRAVEYLRTRVADGGTIGMRDCRALSRDQANAGDRAKGVPIANENTSFGVTIAPHPTHPGMLTSISLISGPPLFAGAVPFAFGVTGIPDFMTDSRLTQKAFVKRANTAWNATDLKTLMEFDDQAETVFRQDFRAAENKMKGRDNQAATQILNYSLSKLANKSFNGTPFQHTDD